MNNVNETVDRLSEFLEKEARTETVIGREFTLGEFTCVPVMRAGLGLGFGGGEGNDGKNTGGGMGGGAGAGMEPIGFLVTRGADIQFIPAQKPSAFGRAMEHIPGLMEKFMSKEKKEKG
jgi:uncharacterized spore protein YtfJ